MFFRLMLFLLIATRAVDSYASDYLSDPYHRYFICVDSISSAYFLDGSSIQVSIDLGLKTCKQELREFSESLVLEIGINDIHALEKRVEEKTKSDFLKIFSGSP